MNQPPLNPEELATRRAKTRRVVIILSLVAVSIYGYFIARTVLSL